MVLSLLKPAGLDWEAPDISIETSENHLAV